MDSAIAVITQLGGADRFNESFLRETNTPVTQFQFRGYRRFQIAFKEDVMLKRRIPGEPIG